MSVMDAAGVGESDLPRESAAGVDASKAKADIEAFWLALSLARQRKAREEFLARQPARPWANCGPPASETNPYLMRIQATSGRFLWMVC